MKDIIERAVRGSISVNEEILSSLQDDITRAAGLMAASLGKRGKILVFGNGGSAADSQHMAAELVGRFKAERRPFAAIALTTDTSILTAVANDYGYDNVFSRQVEALGSPGDVAVGISTSGNSKNVVEAIAKARSMGLATVAIAGCGGGRLASASDVSIAVGSKDTARIQEAHITIIHILCEIIEKSVR